jgi:hypothetical protein
VLTSLQNLASDTEQINAGLALIFGAFTSSTKWGRKKNKTKHSEKHVQG